MGLPENLPFELVEPLRYLFKDEVREVGAALGLPEEMVWRHPFPGPGLAIRVLGEVTQERLETLRAADAIVMDEIRAAGLYRQVWQSFAVLTPVRTVGVMGDYRTYGNVVAVRIVSLAGRDDRRLGARAVRAAGEAVQPDRQRGAWGEPGGVSTSRRSRRGRSNGSRTSRAYIVSRVIGQAPDLAQGYELIMQHDLAAARACFERAVTDERTPEALEGLGLSAWLLSDEHDRLRGSRERVRAVSTAWRCAGRGTARYLAGDRLVHLSRPDGRRQRLAAARPQAARAARGSSGARLAGADRR